MTKLLFSASFINILVLGINFLFKLYLSYHFTKDELGVFYTVLDLVSVGVMFFSGFKDSLIVAFDNREFKRVLFWYSSVFFVVGGGILLVLLFFYKKKFDYPLTIFISLYILNLLAIYLSYINSAYKNYKVMMFERLVEVLGTILTFFIFYYFFHSLYVLFFAFMGGFLFKIVFLKKRIRLNIKRTKLKKRFLKNSLLASLTYFFSGVFISLVGYFILIFGDAEFLGEWQVVIRSLFFSLVTIFIFPLNTYIFPYISKFVAKKEFWQIQRIEKRLLKYLGFFFFAIFLLTFFTKYLVLLFPTQYKHSYIYLNMMLPFLPFIAYTTFALNIIKAFDRFELALFVRISGSLVFFLSFLLFYMLDLKAKSVIFSLDISFFTMFLFSYYFKRRLLAKHPLYPTCAKYKSDKQSL